MRTYICIRSRAVSHMVHGSFYVKHGQKSITINYQHRNILLIIKMSFIVTRLWNTIKLSSRYFNNAENTPKLTDGQLLQKVESLKTKLDQLANQKTTKQLRRSIYGEPV